jgi:TrbL/VirB6 plasmid conjugal transfer protein
VHLAKGAETMQTDFLEFIYKAINDLLTQNLGFFDAMGQHLFRMFATILIAWYGVKSALAAASGKYTFQFDNFASLLLTVAFGFAMINYYSAPIPGVGRSFHNLITDEAQFLANRINQAELQTIVDRIGDFEARIDAPGVTDFLGMAIYIVVIILLAAAQAISIVVIAYGFIATAVCVLVGPVFVPFFIVPKLEWLFWGWLRCFLQYAFYEVVAAAVVYIIGNLMIGVLTLQGTGTISTLQLIGWFPVLLITFIASIYVLLKVPALTTHIFSGTAGGTSAGILEAPADAVKEL